MRRVLRWRMRVWKRSVEEKVEVESVTESAQDCAGHLPTSVPGSV